MTLMLHTGGEPIEYDDLCQLPVPEATKSHVPIAHNDVVNMVRYSLGYFDHEITEEHHAVTPDGMRYFGVLCLKSTYGDYTDMVGLRNSHDKKFPIGISFGSRVFVCDNLAFNGDHVIRRKHTANAKRDLPGIVASVVEPLKLARMNQQKLIHLYQETELTDTWADHVIMELYRKGVINVQRIADVARQWDEPEYDWGGKTAWRLFNATTHALNGRIAENPQSTQQLHEVIDGVCEEVTA